MNHKSVLIFVLLSLQACTFAQEATHHRQLPFTLHNVRENVRVLFPSVKQVSPSGLAARLANSDSLVLLDVRDPQEFAVSHLPGAVRVAPQVDGKSFMEKIDVTNKTVVFYCSVGVRSSKLAQKLQPELLRKGAISVFNLDGGIFAWHNEMRPLEEDSGRTTDFVHPFDPKYKSLLKRQSQARFARASLKEDL